VRVGFDQPHVVVLVAERGGHVAVADVLQRLELLLARGCRQWGSALLERLVHPALASHADSICVFSINTRFVLILFDIV